MIRRVKSSIVPLIAIALWIAPVHTLVAQNRVAVDETTIRADAEARATLNQRATVRVEHASLRNALDAVALAAHVRIGYQIDLVERVHTPVTIHAAGWSIREILDDVLRGTGLHAVAYAPGLLSIERSDTIARTNSGTITGTVTEASTNHPVVGALVTLDGASRGMTTDANGTFRFANVVTGRHTVTVKLLGYGRRTQTVNVIDDGAVTVAVALEHNANTLNQVVVTGTVIPTELKAVPNAITIITSKEIQERGITQIEQLFRGDVPGIFALRQGSSQPLDKMTMFSRGATMMGGSTNQTNPIKTYIDGIEVADPAYLTGIDPNSIERIEIIAGPQASTIYGSNALNGVMQIFTKRGSSPKPQLMLSLLNGWVENNFNNARTPQYDYTGQVNAVDGHVSYNMGGSWNYVGAWTPAKQETRTSSFGGAKFDFPTSAGSLSADVSLRLSNVRNVVRGASYELLNEQQQQGIRAPSASTNGLAQPTTYTLTEQTYGAKLTYAPTSWWSHELTVGQDVTNTEVKQTAPEFGAPYDTAMNYGGTGAVRRDQAYNMTVRTPVTHAVQLTVTAGADAWEKVATNLSLSVQKTTGTLISPSYSISRTPDHNAGGFFQSQLSVVDKIFLTYGTRAEWNPSFGSDVTPVWSPRYGITVTQDVGGITAKARASYGLSTRPPGIGFATSTTIIQDYGAGNTTYLPYYGNIIHFLGNPDLLPEHQQGGEGGVELYFGNYGSLIVTRYNQTVDNLIIQTTADSVRSLIPCTTGCSASSLDADGYGYLRRSEFLNLGTIRNQGWETQASANLGALSVKGTYSWTKSRVLGITPKYRQLFSNIAQYQPGARINYLPEHTWSLEWAYTTRRTTFNLHTSGLGQALVDGNLFSVTQLGQRLQINIPTVTGKYVNMNKPYALTDLNVSSRLTESIDGVFQVQNIGNRNTQDINDLYPTIGRQSKLGFRVRW